MPIGAIASFATGTYTRTRTAVGTTTDGDYTPGATSTTSIIACVQPVEGADLHALPEGRHADNSRVVYTISDLRASPIPDKVTIEGDLYEVFKVERWDAFGATHYKAMVSRLVVP